MTSIVPTNFPSPLTGKETVRGFGVAGNGQPSGEDFYMTSAQIAALGSTPSNPFPATTSTTFGSGTGTFLEEGNIYRAAYLAASAINPGATNADNVLAVYSLPANSFDVSGRGISITASGLLGANSHTKDIKIFFNPSTAVVGSTIGSGGTNVADTGAQTWSGVGWELSANVFKVGAAGSNTQYAQETGVIVGATHGGVGVPVYPTATEGAAILIAVTGNCSTSGSAVTDIALNFVEVNVMN